MGKLQVKLGNKWEYVLHKNSHERHPVITENKEEALEGTRNSIEYFEKHYPKHKFRIK